MNRRPCVYDEPIGRPTGGQGSMLPPPPTYPGNTNVPGGDIEDRVKGLLAEQTAVLTTTLTTFAGQVTAAVQNGIEAGIRASAAHQPSANNDDHFEGGLDRQLLQEVVTQAVAVALGEKRNRSPGDDENVEHEDRRPRPKSTGKKRDSHVNFNFIKAGSFTIRERVNILKMVNSFRKLPDDEWCGFKAGDPRCNNKSPNKRLRPLLPSALGQLVAEKAPYAPNGTQGIAPIIEYTQECHWATEDAIFNIIEKEILPKWLSYKAVFEQSNPHSRRSPPFLLVIDHFPSHAAASFRNRFLSRFGDKGLLVFIPPNCTSHLQPLDVAVFGPFKNAAKIEHTTLLVNGIFQHSFTQSPLAYTVSSQLSRKAAVIAMANAWWSGQKPQQTTPVKDSLTEAWDRILPNEATLPAEGILAAQLVADHTEERNRRGYRKAKKDEPLITFHYGVPRLLHELSKQERYQLDEDIEGYKKDLYDCEDPFSETDDSQSSDEDGEF